MAKSYVAVLAIIVVLTCQSTAAFADFAMKAGPIRNNTDAKRKCVLACSLVPTGSWKRLVEGGMSVCEARNELGFKAGAVPVGPIRSSDEADQKCALGLAMISWTGRWATTVQGSMSVCVCTGEARQNVPMFHKIDISY